MIQFQQAAGLGPTLPQKIDNSIFEKSVESQLQEYEPAPALQPQRPYPYVCVISDIHWPWCNQKVIDKFIEYVASVAKHKPIVILAGDAWDAYSHAKFPRSFNTYSPQEEQRIAREQNELFWKRIREVYDGRQDRLIQMLGNHDIRPLKAALDRYPEAETWIIEGLKKHFAFDGVTTIMDTREEVIIDSQIMVHHGYKSQIGQHRDYTMMNSIVGHTHQGGVSFKQIHGRVLWELNTGFAGDPHGKGLSYTPQKITTWTPGFGVVDPYGPRFIPA